jgi:hypothetical protein
VRIGGDTGKPVALHKDDQAPFLALARNTVARVQEVERETGPKIEISD